MPDDSRQVATYTMPNAVRDQISCKWTAFLISCREGPIFDQVKCLNMLPKSFFDTWPSISNKKRVKFSPNRQLWSRIWPPNHVPKGDFVPLINSLMLWCWYRISIKSIWSWEPFLMTDPVTPISECWIVAILSVSSYKARPLETKTCLQFKVRSSSRFELQPFDREIICVPHV